MTATDILQQNENPEISPAQGELTCEKLEKVYAESRPAPSPAPSKTVVRGRAQRADGPLYGAYPRRETKFDAYRPR